MAQLRLKNVKKTRLFWLYFVLAGLIIVASVLFAPFWKLIDPNLFMANWYSYALGAMLAAAIIVYICTVLTKKLKKSYLHKNVRVAFGVELALMIIFAICCVIKSIFNNSSSFAFFNACEIVGLIIWIRGCVEIINAYYYDRGSKQEYPLWYLLVNVLLVSAGPVVFYLGLSNGSKVDLFVSYAFCFILMVIGILTILVGLSAKPQSVKKPKGKKAVKKEEKAEVKSTKTEETIEEKK